MTHCLEALIARRELIVRARGHFDGVEPVQLGQGLAMLRLDGREANRSPPRAAVPDGFHYIDRFVDAIAEISKSGDVAYVETEYDGIAGDQAAVVYRDGAIVYLEGMIDLDDPQHGGFGNINGALRLLGVTADADQDEFDTVGLQHHR